MSADWSRRPSRPFCRLCAAYLDRHPEHLSPANARGEQLRRLLDVRSYTDNPAEARHLTLPGRLLHERAMMEAGIVPYPEA